VAVNERAPRHDVIDVAVAVDVFDRVDPDAFATKSGIAPTT
jgi:hypothetical protein